MLIPCPYCGLRSQLEFDWGGEFIVRPDPMADSGEWAAYLYLRRNVRGEADERWCHTHGCRQWFGLRRNTVTHEIQGSYRLPPIRSAASQSVTA